MNASSTQSVCHIKYRIINSQITLEMQKMIVKGIVYLIIIFSYMKVNKICNLDHPVY